MPIFQGDALLVSTSLSEAMGAFVPAQASLAASSIAESLAQQATQQNVAANRQQKQDNRRYAPLPEDIIQRGLCIGLMEPCWMRLRAFPEDFAHICLILSKSPGRGSQGANCYFQVYLLVSRV
jgi:hypothetical protein